CFANCSSGKKSLKPGGYFEQVSRVSVHCKLGTRATRNNAYRQWRERVKLNFYSENRICLSIPVTAC
ncbi:hypothetical protein, partial [Gimesia maris]|uniref:hypothetical protein n=1 Tax=Gimesia maris TaxID=122 RepID=UPI003A93C398